MSQQIMKYASNKEFYDDREFEIGQIWWIKDDLISIPQADRLENGRIIHDRRSVVIIHNNDYLINPVCPVVIVAPLSHRVDLKREYDLPIFKDIDGVKKDSLIRLELMQPVLKKDLEDLQGCLSEKKIEELIAMQLVMIGIE